MGFELHNAQRFYETLALIMGNRGCKYKSNSYRKKEEPASSCAEQEGDGKGGMTSERDCKDNT